MPKIKIDSSTLPQDGEKIRWQTHRDYNTDNWKEGIFHKGDNENMFCVGFEDPCPDFDYAFDVFRWEKNSTNRNENSYEIKELKNLKNSYKKMLLDIINTSSYLKTPTYLTDPEMLTDFGIGKVGHDILCHDFFELSFWYDANNDSLVLQYKELDSMGNDLEMKIIFEEKDIDHEIYDVIKNAAKVDIGREQKKIDK